MYSIVLLLHSWIRWIALVSAVGATLAALRGKVETDRSIADRWGMAAMMALDLQMLLGLLLYFGLSPNMQEILNHFGESMRRADTRFYAVEHIAAMFIAVALSHVGRVLARRAATPAAKRTRLLVCFGLATLLILVGMPWPGRPGGRDLFRFRV
jgi:heme A synthase